MEHGPNNVRQLEQYPYTVWLATDSHINKAAALLHVATDQKSAVKKLLDSRVLEKCDEAMVACGEDGVLGMAALERCFVNNKELELKSLYVLPTYRERGIGTRLVYASLQRAQQRGCRGLKIQVGTDAMWWLLNKLPKERQVLLHIIDGRRHADESLGAVSANEHERQRQGLGRALTYYRLR